MNKWPLALINARYKVSQTATLDKVESLPLLDVSVILGQCSGSAAAAACLSHQKQKRTFVNSSPQADVCSFVRRNECFEG